MTGQQLNVAERATSVMSQSGSTGNERTSPRVGRTAVETNDPISVGKPDYDTQWRHRAAAFRNDHWPDPLGHSP